MDNLKHSKLFFLQKIELKHTKQYISRAIKTYGVGITVFGQHQTLKFTIPAADQLTIFPLRILT